MLSQNRFDVWITRLASVIAIAGWIASVAYFLYQLITHGPVGLHLWFVVVAPLALSVLWLLYRVSVPIATWVTAHRRQVLFCFLCLALLTSVVVLPPVRYAVAIAAVFLLAYYGWRTYGFRPALEFEAVLHEPVKKATVVFEGPLTAETIQAQEWSFSPGQPSMLSATAEGLVVAWESGAQYTESGQVTLEFPQADRWIVEARMVPQVYASGWDPGMYLYGNQQFPALIGVGFMPAGSPIPPPPGKAQIPFYDGLAMQVGTPGIPMSMGPHDKYPVPAGKDTRVAIVGQNGEVDVYVDGYAFWHGQLAEQPSAICIGAFRWPVEPSQAPNSFPAGRHVVRDLRIVAFD